MGKRIRSSSAVSNAAILDETMAKHSKAEGSKVEAVAKHNKADAEEATDQYTVATGETFPMLLIEATPHVVLTASNTGVPVYQGPSQFAFVLDTPAEQHAPEQSAPWTFTGRDLTLEHTSLYGPDGALSQVFGTKAEMVAEEFYSEEMKALGYDTLFCDANGLSKQLRVNSIATNMLLSGKGTRHISHAVYGPVVLVSMKVLETEQSNHSEDIEGEDEDGEDDEDGDEEYEEEQEDREDDEAYEDEEDEEDEEEEDSEDEDEDSEE